MSVQLPNKIYVVFWKDELIAARTNEAMARAYAEGNFGTKEDGILNVDNVAIVEYTFTVQNA